MFQKHRGEKGESGEALTLGNLRAPKGDLKRFGNGEICSENADQKRS